MMMKLSTLKEKIDELYCSEGEDAWVEVNWVSPEEIRNHLDNRGCPQDFVASIEDDDLLQEFHENYATLEEEAYHSAINSIAERIMRDKDFWNALDGVMPADLPSLAN